MTLSVQNLLRLLRRPAVVSLLGNGASAAAGLLTLALLARWLRPDVFGLWILYQTSYALFDNVRMGAVVNAFIRYVAKAPTEADIRQMVGAAWQVGLGFTAVVLLVLLGVVFLIPPARAYLGDPSTALWFAATSVVAFPAVVATWWLHSRSQFLPLQGVRLVSQVLFLLFITPVYFYKNLTYSDLCLAFLLANGLGSLLTLRLGYCRLSDIPYGRASQRRELYEFGKYAIGSFLGTNLLRSADVFLLGAFVGPGAVALYSVPLRLLQIIETPIRSIVVTSIPRLAELHQRHRLVELTDYFHRAAGRLWLALLPLSLGGVLLAKYLLLVLGGSRYAGGAVILQIFMIQGLLLPLDRYSGVCLDAIGYPRANLTKIMLMLAVTVSGDLLILSNGGSPEAVAGVSLATFSFGLILGYHMLSRHVPVSIVEAVRTGWRELRGLGLRALRV